MIDLILIKLLLSKDLFNKFSKVINLEFYKNNNREVFRILSCLFQLHEKVSVDITVQDLVMYFFTSYPAIKNDEKVLYNTIFDQIEKAEVSPEIAVEYLEKHRQQILATEIAMKALDVSRGKGDLSAIVAMLNEQIPIEEPTEEVFVSDDLEVLTEEVQSEEGLRWRLQTMNKMMGSLRKGNFGFIFARPETGKTTFLASECTFMAEQAKGPVLWFNNEQVGSEVMLRCYQAVFGVSEQELYTNLDYYSEEYKNKIQGKLKIIDNAIITRKKVEELCAKYNPSLVVFDQIDKIYGFEADRYDLKMKAIYIWARELAKKYCPVIGVCQAGGTAEGKKYLNMNDVDSSHTAKQSECDFMIGIGASNTEGDEFSRYLSICKNKLRGDFDTQPELRHGKMPIIIEPMIARYRDAMTWK
jgi:replicative DNA helicase